MSIDIMYSSIRVKFSRLEWVRLWWMVRLLLVIMFNYEVWSMDIYSSPKDDVAKGMFLFFSRPIGFILSLAFILVSIKNIKNTCLVITDHRTKELIAVVDTVRHVGNGVSCPTTKLYFKKFGIWWRKYSYDPYYRNEQSDSFSPEEWFSRHRGSWRDWYDVHSKD